MPLSVTSISCEIPFISTVQEFSAPLSSGGKYYLDEAILTAAGSDFHSVGDRMEVVVPSDRLEQTLDVIMKQRGYPLAAFD